MSNCNLCNNIKEVLYPLTNAFSCPTNKVNITVFDEQYYCLCFVIANIKGKFKHESRDGLIQYEIEQAIKTDGLVTIFYNDHAYICIKYNFIQQSNHFALNINKINVPKNEFDKIAGFIKNRKIERDYELLAQRIYEQDDTMKKIIKDNKNLYIYMIKINMLITKYQKNKLYHKRIICILLLLLVFVNIIQIF